MNSDINKKCMQDIFNHFIMITMQSQQSIIGSIQVNSKLTLINMLMELTNHVC